MAELCQPRVAVIREACTVDPSIKRCVVEGVTGGVVTLSHRPIKVQVLDCQDCSVILAAGPALATTEVVRCARSRVVISVERSGASVTVDESSLCVVELPHLPEASKVYCSGSRGIVVVSRQKGPETAAGSTDDDQAEEVHQVADSLETGLRIVTAFRRESGFSSTRGNMFGTEAVENGGHDEDQDYQTFLARGGRQGASARDDDNDAISRTLRALRKRTQRELAEGQRAVEGPVVLPCFLLPDLLLADQASVSDAHGLRALGVTHVLNVAAGSTRDLRRDYEAVGVTLIEIHAEDSVWYDVMQHWDAARDAYDAARSTNLRPGTAETKMAPAESIKGPGRLVVHCHAGINRSGALATALYMHATKTPLLAAAGHVNRRRGSYLWNPSFARQLVLWARAHDLDDSASSHGRDFHAHVPPPTAGPGP